MHFELSYTLGKLREAAINNFFFNGRAIMKGGKGIAIKVFKKKVFSEAQGSDGH